MHCRYCNSSYRLTKWHNDKNACPDCDGITDNLNIDDAEIQLDIWNLKHPTGKTEAVFEYDEYTDV